MIRNSAKHHTRQTLDNISFRDYEFGFMEQLEPFKTTESILIAV